MAVRASREIVIDAPPEAVLDALADVEAVPTWSSIHKHARVVDRYDNGRPRRVEVTVKLLGLVDHEILEYHWGRDWVVFDADRTAQQHDQHVEYTLRREGDATRVRFDITLEPSAPLPHFLVKRAKKTVLEAATEGLRRRVLNGKTSTATG
ncbi:SRPBCC family protein [Mycobacterium sp. CVI_P3]|uniref:SRPBCC family protein n=1 Tax=Mycobacterium pinniadriaticum TaxID=2994102 RepID=A0ABT3S7D1_9MYCO|nr:SRPBCC family protein [Mycobacterium pinniadriaticum]MCX2928722.1 SRPBCC family protein [Mycobacterium pinniadriaticum]MCX2935411.1 SRPBCC family protein [Mycobacterium pinniadriaticum]